jgi:two-component system, LuxR family, sensor kinase FixL
VNPFKILSIRKQLFVLILSASMASVAAALVVLMVGDIRSFRRGVKESSVLMARMVGDWSLYDLKFNIRDDARRTLARLSAFPDVEGALLYDASWRVLASYHKPGTSPLVPPAGLTAPVFEGGRLHVQHPIQEGGNTYGTLYLCLSYRSLQSEIRSYILTVAGLMGFLIAVSVFFAVKAHAAISRPLRRLSAMARRVSEEGDYSIRAPEYTGGEAGILGGAFNAVLERIQRHEQARDEAEEALRRSEDRLRHIIEQSSDALYVRMGRRLVFVNPQLENYCEYSAGEICSPEFDFMKLVAPEDREAMQDRIARQARGETLASPFMFRGLSKSGRIYHFEASVAEVAWDGKPAILSTLRDITPHVRAEETLRAQQRLLARNAEDLERSNRELEQFAYVASHDLQEPLRKVQAFSDRLHEKFSGRLGEQGQDYLERMQSAARRMSTLIDDLLTFSRVTSRAQPFRPTDLNRILKEVLADLELRIEQEKAAITAAPLPTLDADAVQMGQLLQNLLGNALKFHKAGEPPVIRVRAESVEPSDGGAASCRLIVADNGIGFEEKYLDRIFTVFQRLHGRQEYEGTGIGLAICRKIVERHGGTLTARSSPGHGSEFIATLPLRQTEGEPHD